MTGELVLSGHTDLKDLRGFLPSRHHRTRPAGEGHARGILRLAHPVLLGHPEKRFNRIRTDRQADRSSPRCAVSSWYVKIAQTPGVTRPRAWPQ